MNSIIDRLLLASSLSNPYKSDMDKFKEIIKYCIEDLQISDCHKANMKAIVQQSNTIEKMLYTLFSYMLIGDKIYEFVRYWNRRIIKGNLKW